MYSIMKHDENQHGFSVSLLKYTNIKDPCSLENGFVLISHKTRQQQEKYINELKEMTGWNVEEGF